MIDCRVSGAWPHISTVGVKVSGVWKTDVSVYTRVSGVWKLLHPTGFGIFAGGDTNYTNRYCFALGTVTAGTLLASTSRGISACSSLTHGIFGGGIYGSDYLDRVEKYRYADNVVSAGTSLGMGRQNLAACGNTALGIFGAGLTVRFMVKQTTLTNILTRVIQ